MKKVALSEMVRFIPGINSTRVKKQYGVEIESYYDYESFEKDYKQKDEPETSYKNDSLISELSLKEGDVVVNNSLYLATIVGKYNVGKILSLNFTKVEFDESKLDKQYFLFLFNSCKDVKNQKDSKLQGSSSVLRIPIRELGDVMVPVVSLEEQKKIGNIYIESMKLQSKLLKYADLMNQFTTTMIEDTLKGGA